MISLEQVQLLEEKVSKAIEYVKRVKQENASLIAEKETLISKLEANQKRLDKLEAHVLSFKEDQGRIEDGILAALDRLSQFEEAFEKSLKDTNGKESKPRQTATPKEKEPDTSEVHFELSDENSAEAEREESDSSVTEAELDIF